MGGRRDPGDPASSSERLFWGEGAGARDTAESGCIGQPLGIHVSPREVWQESLSSVSKLQPRGQMLFSVACELRMALHF